jgi:hypothetical protein
MATGLEKTWRRAAALAPEHALALPFAGERVAVIGTGIARGVARAYAALREDAAHGQTDAPAPDEVPRRGYERTVLLSRSGDEPALVDLVEWLRSEAILAIALGAPAGSPLDELAGATVPLAHVAGSGGDDGAYALTSLAVLRQHLLGTTGGADAARALRAPLPDVRGVGRWVFVGHRWSLGLAEAAARAFRRRGADAIAGPVSELEAGDLGTLDPRTLLWWFEPDGSARGVEAIRRSNGDTSDEDDGPAVRVGSLDPAAELALALRLADTLG